MKSVGDGLVRFVTNIDYEQKISGQQSFGFFPAFRMLVATLRIYNICIQYDLVSWKG